MKPKSLPSLMASALVTLLAGQGLAAPLWPGGKDERVSRPDAHWVAIADELSRSFVGVSGDQCSLPPITDAGNRFDLRTVRVLRVASPTRTAMMVLTTALACDAKEIHNDPQNLYYCDHCKNNEISFHKLNLKKQKKTKNKNFRPTAHKG